MMDRMTHKSGMLMANLTVRGDCAAYNQAIARLAAYEDTGMTPAEIVEMREQLEATRGVVSKMENTTEKQSVAGNPATANRVLSLAEVLALPDGERVWVEDKFFKSCVHTARRGYVDDVEYGGDDEKYDFALVDENHKFWPLCDGCEKAKYGRKYHVWSLPVAPTEDELRGNPWGKEGE